MADLSASAPLLRERKLEFGYSKNRAILQTLAKFVIKSLMWVIFVVWVAAIFFFPTEFVQKLYSKWIKSTRGSFFGVTGSIFLGFSAPILVIAILAFIYVAAFSGEKIERNNYKFPRYRLWTFPVLVDGPFGVVSAAELIGIVLFAAYVFWSLAAYIVQSQGMIEGSSITLKEKSELMLEIMGLRLGLIGLFCLAFLFLPVSRGSILLRMTDIPFEQATRYHVWLGHLTMAIFTLHGLFLMIAWAMQGRLLEQILNWRDIGIANLPGVISLSAGLLMWVTSLHPVRRAYFEVFFYTHQLYVIFVVFLALHVGDFIFSFAAGAIFLFILDRFLRFCQSRTTVDVVSAACRPCGTLELVLSKPPRLHYNALSFVFLQVRELSWLQWHPFSVSSSPLDGKHHLSILIKVLGEWTCKLRDIITTVSEHPQNNLESQVKLITASVEGPYGHEVPYHLMYENLLLIAGGIGISPFFAILSDILHLSNEGKPYLPKNILVIWAVKKTAELSLLSTIDVQSICPSFSERLHLEIQTYVTQESEPPLEDGRFNEKAGYPRPLIMSSISMSCLVGTGHKIWAGIYVFVSTIGFIIFYGLLELYYIKPHQVFSWWYKGLMFTLCMVASVVTLGAIVIFFWNKWEQKSSSNESGMGRDEEKESLLNHNVFVTDDEKENLTSVQTITYGSRPNFREIFSSHAEQVGHVNVGVIVCGPPGLQTSVAKECRFQNIRGKWNHPIFHFNSHSFDL
ncbi:ferric reduction oxidase 6-like [Phalaenopsis equestris]|uniref:ferric reduction oxidase 6-like n=1 Tax=Phalaenopsis equestris TaxID=78828 RepID=UPI0009E42EDA|nr:ferric reduction oxidase 6-like [Phalaenopsis equestris]XP_020571376.1 ferric reduction oxidase 6-like [Phalaenopsis equestris]